jgi:hypothetical protein
MVILNIILNWLNMPRIIVINIFILNYLDQMLYPEPIFNCFQTPEGV